MKCLKIKSLIVILFLIVSCNSCKKEWLDAKPNQAFVILNRISDLQSLLDNTTYFNSSFSQPTLTELGTNDYYINYTTYQSQGERNKNIYGWASGPNFFATGTVRDWEEVYKTVFLANTTIENIGKIVPDTTNYDAWKNVKGTALFYRAWAFYNLAQLFCKPYISSSANLDLGIVLRLESDFNVPSQRSTVKQTYNQIISDLMEAKLLLPSAIPQYKTRPSKPAVYAMLARVYLSMQDYIKAKDNADSTLLNYNSLMDYNSISATLRFPFSQYNSEVIFHTDIFANAMFPTSSGYVDSVLFSSYATKDLRKTRFFKVLSGNRLSFGGTYTGRNTLFSGLATDEIYLIRAECYARNGDKNAALQDLNTLMIMRWKNDGSWVPFTATDTNDALIKILGERKKELCFRAIRWTDLRRLNQDLQFAITLNRGILNNSATFTLPPNDNRYVYPIPQSEILYSGIAQNPR